MSRVPPSVCCSPRCPKAREAIVPDNSRCGSTSSELRAAFRLAPFCLNQPNTRLEKSKEITSLGSWPGTASRCPKGDAYALVAELPDQRVAGMQACGEGVALWQAGNPNRLRKCEKPARLKTSACRVNGPERSGCAATIWFSSATDAGIIFHFAAPIDGLRIRTHRSSVSRSAARALAFDRIWSLTETPLGSTRSSIGPDSPATYRATEGHYHGIGDLGGAGTTWDTIAGASSPRSLQAIRSVAA